MNLSDTPSVSFSDLMSTVVSYFGFNTGSAEREAKTTTISIRNAFPLVSNLQEVDFSNLSGKIITILNPACRPADLTYFTFRSVVSATSVNIHAPASSLSLEFYLRLPQTLRDSASNYAAIIKTPTVPALVTIPPKPIEDISFKSGMFLMISFLRGELIIRWHFLSTLVIHFFSRSYSFFFRSTVNFI